MSSDQNPDILSPEQLQHIEDELNSDRAKRGHGFGVPNAVRKDQTNWSDSTRESGVDQNVDLHFPGVEVRYGGVATGRIIPPQDGGEMLPAEHGLRPTSDKDFEGPGGPEDKARLQVSNHPGDDGVPERQVHH